MKRTLLNRLAISFILGLSCSFNYVSIVFISMQLQGALRSFWLFTLFDLKALMTLFVGFVLSMLIIKKTTKQMYLWAITILILSITFWGHIGDPPLSEWFLPPVKSK